MPRRVILYIGIGIALFTALLLYLLQDSPQINPFKSKKQPKVENVFDSWEESYKIEEGNATGISLFNELLEYKTKKASTLIEHELKAADLSDSNTTYIFVGNQFQLKTEEFDSIMNEVHKGANLFIAYKDISSNLFTYFFNQSGFCWDYDEDVSVTADSIYSLSAVYQGDTVANQWNFYNFNHIKEGINPDIEYVYSLSEIYDYSNFLDFGIGAGHVYLHSNPELFQNYQLLSPNGFHYSQYVVDIIPENHQIKWLELGRFENDGSNLNGDSDENGEQDNSLLQFIFNNKALTVALLLTLLGIILFLIFRTKRSQPLVPYIAEKGNQSLAFAETVKEIYYKKQTPHSILLVMKKNFYVAVQKQFFVDISKEHRDLELKALSEKTGMKMEDLKEFLKKLECKREILIDYAYLEEVSDLQQKFYHQTGIIKDRVKNKIAAKSKVFNRKIILPIGLIVIGIANILFAFYLLHKSEGIGISLWPVGILIIAFGIRLYRLPLMKLENNTLTFYPIFGKSSSILLSDIEHVVLNQNRTVFITSKDEKYSVNHTELSVYDKHAYEQFIFPFLNKSL
ncbi:MAG: DUF4350 domain-containing protein [Flavobacteriia bacterium]|jgi:hypothetical protein